MEDKGVGFMISAISLSIFTYYTFWVIVLPFVDEDHFIHNYFLPQEFAILIPVFGGVALLGFLCLFIGFVLLKPRCSACCKTATYIAHQYSNSGNHQYPDLEFMANGWCTIKDCVKKANEIMNHSPEPWWNSF